MANRPTARYKCSQSDLYTAADQIITSAQNDLPQLNELKGKYNQQFITNAQAKLTAAQALPDFQARDFFAETARIELLALRQKACNIWQFLKLYITDTPEFSGDLLKPALEAAGSSYYEQAKSDFPKTRTLLQTAETFLNTANNMVLLHNNNQNMPDTFPIKIANIRQEFEQKYNQFLQAEQTAKEQTDAKINANNELHELIISICTDGQRLFMSDPTHAERYIFDRVTNLISSAGPAGLKGTITDKETNNPIQQATITLIESAQTATTNEIGYYDFGNISSGKYTILVQHPNYIQQIQNIRIQVGTTQTQNITLQQ